MCGDCSYQGFTRQHVGERNGMCPRGHRNRTKPHTCRCGHHASAHSNIENGECLADGCGCERLTEMLSCGYYDTEG